MCSDLFVYDPTSNEVEPETHDPGPALLAGINKDLAVQMLEIVRNLAVVLVDNTKLTPEEALKKIRWATHVVQNDM